MKKFDNGYQLRRAVAREMQKLGLHNNKHMLVTECGGDCPWMAWRKPDEPADPVCELGGIQLPKSLLPPHNCPLRGQAHTVALDPKA
jgi:hypothetical protein